MQESSDKKMTWFEFSSMYCERQEQTVEGLRLILLAQSVRYHPIGWMLLECHQFDSSRFNSLTILPYGPENSLKEIPKHPISPRGLASDMSVVIGVLSVEDFNSGIGRKTNAS